ncbi:MAG: hypothetical protein PHT50_06270 [Candidatus Omnitrophica bacterium]|nr:hypothetical protein [Candidatus Omnitrophota bacterium]
MNKNAVYLAVFAALCVLAGVLVGAGITKRQNLPWHGQGRQNFRERAERYMGMGYGQKGYGERKGACGPVETLAIKLGLNAEQKAKVIQILEKSRQEITEVGKNLRSTITEIKEKGDKQIMSILNPEQQEKFKALLKDAKEGCGFVNPEKKCGPMGKYRLQSGKRLHAKRQCQG